MKKLLLGCLVLLSFACEKKLEEELAEAANLFDGKTCDQTVTSDIDDTAFTALLQSGTSSASVYRICIAPGISVNATSGNSISMSNTNIEIRGANTLTSKIYNLSVTSSGAGNIVKFVNINIENTNNVNPIYLSGTAPVYIETSIVSGTAAGGPSLQVGNDAVAHVTGSTLSSSDDTAMMVLAQVGANTNATITNSTIIAHSYGLYLLSQSSSVASATVKGNTFKTFVKSGSPTTTGIRALAQSSTVSLNDASTSPLNLFCNHPNTTTSMTVVLDAINQSGTINGNFSANNTQNGSNTNISTCP